MHPHEALTDKSIVNHLLPLADECGISSGHAVGAVALIGPSQVIIASS